MLDELAPPPLTDSSRRWIRALHEDHAKGKEVEEDILQFVEYYGTHIVSGVVMGAKLVYNFTML